MSLIFLTSLPPRFAASIDAARRNFMLTVVEEEEEEL